MLPAALAAAELADRDGACLLRALALGCDVGARFVMALGLGGAYARPHRTHSLGGPFGAAAAAGALLGLDARRVRFQLSYAVQQASGLAYWMRDPDHIEKAFDFGGMPARNGVAAATMAAAGFTLPTNGGFGSTTGRSVGLATAGRVGSHPSGFGARADTCRR